MSHDDEVKCGSLHHGSDDRGSELHAMRSRHGLLQLNAGRSICRSSSSVVEVLLVVLLVQLHVLSAVHRALRCDCHAFNLKASDGSPTQAVLRASCVCRIDHAIGSASGERHINILCVFEESLPDISDGQVHSMVAAPPAVQQLEATRRSRAFYPTAPFPW